MPASTLRRAIIDGRDVILVMVAAVAGMVLTAPGRVIVDRGAINVALFVLVAAAAMTMPANAVRELTPRIARLSGVAVIGLVALPFLAWLAAQVVPEGPARFGVMAIGVAPAEIATVVLTAAAAGATVTAVYMLLFSTLITAVTAAPVLRLLAGSGAVRTTELILTVWLVVVLPFAIGLVAGRRWPARKSTATSVAAGSVVVLVGLVATQVALDASFARVLAALLGLLALCALLGAALSRLVTPLDRVAIVLSFSMRDFAVASGIAAAAFGPEAAAPLGIYGVIVMIWGSAIAAIQRRRTTRGQGCSPVATPRLDTDRSPTA